MDAERLLGNLLGGTLGRSIGRRGSSIFRGGSLTTKANLGIGLLGLAMAAFEHYQQQSAQATQASVGATPPPPPRSSPPPMPAAVPPPPPQTMVSPATRQADSIVLIADSDAERAWLDRLGDALHLDASTRQRIDRELALR